MESLQIEREGCAAASTGTGWEGGSRGSTRLVRFRWDGETYLGGSPALCSQN